MKDLPLEARATAKTLDDVLPETLIEAEILAARIERAVRHRTGDAVRSLLVQVSRQGVLLKGRCDTFYCKQLAQQAAMGFAGNERLTNAIEVA